MSVLERVREQEARGVVSEMSSEEASLGTTPGGETLSSTLKRELMRRLGLATVADMVGTSDAEKARDELRVTCQAILNEERFSGLSDTERESVIRRVLDEVVGLGPIQPLLDDMSISEVMVNGCEAMYYERAGKLHRSEVRFESADQIMMVIDRILAPLGRRLMHEQIY